jgi:hypothetical protein
MTGGDAAFKARGFPPIFCENRFPPRPLAGRCPASSGPDSPVATRLRHAVLNHEDQQQEALMGMISHLSANGTQTFAALVLELEAEFGSSETAGLAAHYLDAEAADFHWEARQIERHLGAYESLDETRDDLESICIIGFLNERWFVATCIVDGDGAVQDMIRLRHFTSAWDADQAFNRDG